MNKTTSTKLNINDIIATRVKICDTKTKFWKIIMSENKMSKKAKAANVGSGMDLNVVYNKILQMTNHLIKIKLMINNINNGDLTFDFDTEKSKHYYNIYLASELKEQYAKWKELVQRKKFIDPAAKSKAGKKGTGFVETFSYHKIKSIMDKLELDINAVDAKIKKYNDDNSIEITSDDMEDLKEYFAV